MVFLNAFLVGWSWGRLLVVINPLPGFDLFREMIRNRIQKTRFEMTNFVETRDHSQKSWPFFVCSSRLVKFQFSYKKSGRNTADSDFLLFYFVFLSRDGQKRSTKIYSVAANHTANCRARHANSFIISPRSGRCFTSPTGLSSAH